MYNIKTTTTGTQIESRRHTNQCIPSGKNSLGYCPTNAPQSPVHHHLTWKLTSRAFFNGQKTGKIHKLISRGPMQAVPAAPITWCSVGSTLWTAWEWAMSCSGMIPTVSLPWHLYLIGWQPLKCLTVTVCAGCVTTRHLAQTQVPSVSLCPCSDGFTNWYTFFNV